MESATPTNRAPARSLKDIQMIDFTKLLNTSPEQREADRQAQYAEFTARTNATIVARLAMLEDIANSSRLLNEWETGFFESLQRKAKAFDVVGRIPGGCLADLSDSQVKHLESLHTTCTAAPHPLQRA